MKKKKAGIEPVFFVLGDGLSDGCGVVFGGESRSDIWLQEAGFFGVLGEHRPLSPTLSPRGRGSDRGEQDRSMRMVAVVSDEANGLRSALSLPSGSDGVPPLSSERARSHPRSRRGLAALELVGQYQAHHAMHGVGIETLRHDLRL